MEPRPALLPEAPPCPFCGGKDTKLVNAFGSHASLSTYWCGACKSPFELVRWRGGEAGAREPGTAWGAEKEPGAESVEQKRG